MWAHLQEGGVLLIQFKPCVASAIMIPHLIPEGIKQTSKNHECYEREEKHLPKLPPQASFSHLTMLMTSWSCCPVTILRSTHMVTHLCVPLSHPVSKLHCAVTNIRQPLPCPPTWSPTHVCPTQSRGLTSTSAPFFPIQTKQGNSRRLFLLTQI